MDKKFLLFNLVSFLLPVFMLSSAQGFTERTRGT
jgi:hypothetical protein